MTSRRGFTLVEMLMAITLTLVVFGSALTFFRAQTAALHGHAGRWDALQNAQFGSNALDRELRVAGIGVLPKQPLIVQAHPMAVTFNGDLISRQKTDVRAVYYDRDASPSTVLAMTPSQRINLPHAMRSYPDSAYEEAAGVPGAAETVSYWVTLDSSTARSDDYVLLRRVNNAAPDVVVQSVIIPSGQPVFRYYTVDSLGVNIEIPSGSALYHTAIHGSKADTGASRRTDSIRVVKVRLTSVYRSSDGTDRMRTVETSIRIVNSGLINRSTCGEAPAFGTTVTAVATTAADGKSQVDLSWLAASDETGGETDVERYVIYRRPVGTALFGEPLTSIPAGVAAYQYSDIDVRGGEQWVYGVAAQDCTPSSSGVVTSGTVTVPGAVVPIDPLLPLPPLLPPAA